MALDRQPTGSLPGETRRLPAGGRRPTARSTPSPDVRFPEDLWAPLVPIYEEEDETVA